MNTEQIWLKYKRDLEKFAGSRIRNADAVQDVLQDVFIKIHLKKDQLQNQEDLRAWVYQIARNSITDYFRNAKNNHLFLDEHPDTADEESGTGVNLAGCLRKMIQGLPEKYRNAIMQVELKRKSQRELSKESGISYSALKSRVQRGRALLFSYINKCCKVSADKYGNIISYEAKTKCLCQDC